MIKWITESSYYKILGYISFFNAWCYHITPTIASILGKDSRELSHFCLQATVGYGALGALLIIIDEIKKQNKILTEDK